MAREPDHPVHDDAPEYPSVQVRRDERANRDRAQPVCLWIGN